MSIKERWDRQRQRDEAHVEQMADQVMRDTRWDRVRGLRTRQGLVVVLAVLVLSMVPAYLVGGALGVLPVAGATAVWLVLRLAVRVVAELPEQYLDERQSNRRNRAYVSAYQAFSGAMLVVGMGFFGWSLAVAPADLVLRLNIDVILGAYFTLTALALTLPTAVMAWTEPEV